MRLSHVLYIFFLVLAVADALITLAILFQLQQPASPLLWGLKVFSSALSPLLFLTGLLCVVVGLFWSWLPVSLLGTYSIIIFGMHMFSITRAPDTGTGFTQAFGHQWEKKIPAGPAIYFLKSRADLKLPAVPDPVLRQNISFYTIPGTARELLCDIWEPPAMVARSGLAFIYLHGSAWSVLDKDFGTRTFFRHMAAQGHVIMDVAYRLFPETDMLGMVFDTKHAIAWMKANAAAYQINPARIVIGGSSAGGHLTLLTAYTEQHKQFTPPDLQDVDTSVRGVISLYGPPQLEALYYHTGQHLTTHPTTGKPLKEPGEMPAWAKKMMGDYYHRLGLDKNLMPGALAYMFGGHPDKQPEIYSRLSPVTYVNTNCPPTLLIQGEHDLITPVKTVQLLHERLTQAGVPVVLHLLPQTDHAFDLVLPKMSFSAHNAFYDVERFLALMI